MIIFYWYDDLLEFLSNCKDNGVIKNNLRKLYKGITTLNINDDNNVIFYQFWEKVEWGKKFLISDELEQLINDLINEMRKTPLGYISNSVNEFKIKKIIFLI